MQQVICASPASSKLQKQNPQFPPLPKPPQSALHAQKLTSASNGWLFWNRGMKGTCSVTQCTQDSFKKPSADCFPKPSVESIGKNYSTSNLPKTAPRAGGSSQYNNTNTWLKFAGRTLRQDPECVLRVNCSVSWRQPSKKAVQADLRIYLPGRNSGTRPVRMLAVKTEVT